VQWNLLPRISINSPAEGIPDLKNRSAIAIIDDNALVRDGIQRLVTSLDYSARAFSSTDEFLASDSPPDVRCIISDVQMAGSDAQQLQERLFAIGCKAPIVFMTALQNRKLESELVHAGAICVLAKPFNQLQLIPHIATAFALYKNKMDDDCGCPNRDSGQHDEWCEGNTLWA
jgi:FixJ family two-component response regulator